MTLPVVLTTIEQTRAAVTAARRGGRAIGLVPTMGALHEGHASLVRAAQAGTEFVVVSIFVNPTQFAPTEDLAKYPRTFDADRDLCGRNGADAIFVPTPDEMYPHGFRTYVEVHNWQNVLCGVTRPTHFRGVCTVVSKLFNIVLPDVAYFGQKDAQQALIVKRLVRDLNVPVRVEVCPTVREPDGLAMSSRNRYLSADERTAAPALYRALGLARDHFRAGERNPAALERLIAGELAKVPGLRLDYARVVSADTLEPADPLAGEVLIAVAAFLGTTRLIDNVLVTVP